MPSRYQIYVTDWEFGYFDNSIQTYRPTYRTDSNGRNANRTALMNSLKSVEGSVDLPTIHAGKCLLKLNKYSYSWPPTNIILKDLETNWYYFYFCESSGRLFNGESSSNYVEEYKISLNNYATFLDPFIVDSINGSKNLFDGLKPLKSNAVPVWSVPPRGSIISTIKNTYQFTALSNSITNMPEYINISNAELRLFSSKYNIFNSDGFSDNKGNWKKTSFSYSQFSQGTAGGLRLSTVTFQNQGRSFTANVIYRDADFMHTVNQKIWNSTDINNNIRDFVNSNDSDTWVLYSVTGRWWQNFHSILEWDGLGDGSETNRNNSIIIAVPCGGGRWNQALGLLERFSDRPDKGFAMLGVFKTKANNFFESYRPTAVAVFGCNDLNVGCGGNQKNNFMMGWVLSGIGGGYTTTVPQKFLGWYQTKSIQIELLLQQLFPNFGAFENLIKIPQDCIAASLHFPNNLILSFNIDDKWINYDYNTYQRGWTIDLNYSMIGYEMTWISLPDEAYGTLLPWKDNRFSLGLSNVKVNNLGKYNNSAQATINSNAGQWEVGQNIAQAKAEHEGLNEASKIGMSVTRNMFSVSGIINNILTTGSGIAQMSRDYENAKWDTKLAEMEAERWPAIKQDNLNSATASFPAGDILWTTNLPINMYVYGWDINTRINVVNYCNEFGWFNGSIYDWTPVNLSYSRSSAIFKYTQNPSNWNITPAWNCSNVTFVPNPSQVTRNLNSFEKLTVGGYSRRLVIPADIRRWFVNLFEKGIRQRWELSDAQRREAPYQIPTKPEIDWSKVILKPQDHIWENTYGCEQNAQATTQTKAKRGANCEPCKTNRQRTRTRAKKTDSINNRVRSRVPKSEG